MYDTGTGELVIAGLPSVIPIRLGKTGQYGQVQVDLTRLPLVALQYLILYGMKQATNDKMATKTDKHGAILSDDMIRAKVAERVEGWYAGVVRQRGGGKTLIGVDRVRAEAHTLALEVLKKEYQAKGYMVNIPKGTKDRHLFVANRFRSNRGMPPFTREEWLDNFLSSPGGKILMNRAERNVREADESIVEGDSLLSMLEDINAADSEGDGDTGDAGVAGDGEGEQAA